MKEGNAVMVDPIKDWNFLCETHQLRMDFDGAQKIQQNFSQAFQDIFIISAMAGKKNGSFLEIGAMHPIYNNNTNLLESKFGWHGVSIDNNIDCAPPWPFFRPSTNFVLSDALELDYLKLLPIWFGQDVYQIDYLQLDIDPSINTLHALQKLPLEQYRFSVITFETDAYVGDLRAQKQSREILHLLGYELVGMDVCVVWDDYSTEPIAFEDWWVDPKIINKEKIDCFKAIKTKPLLPQYLLFK